MSRIHPQGWRCVPADGPMGREIETLATFARALPDDYSVFHHVHWARVSRDAVAFGDVDFIVVGPGGMLLLIEQESGFLEETRDGLAKRRKLVNASLSRSAENLRARLSTVLGEEAAAVDCLLYCPDYTVRQQGSAGIDPARIVDASRRDRLVEIVRGIAGGEEAKPLVRERIERFLSDALELAPDPNALVGQAHTLYTRLAGGLAEWARRIEMHPFRLRVTGTAGSGKTQLALAVMRDALNAGRRPLYVCYNRPLADHIALIAPPGAEIATYHQLCDRFARAAGRAPDFSDSRAFARLVHDFAALEIAPDDQFDELIVDEGQDFEQDWRDPLLRLLRPQGRAWWLEDPLQNLYGRAEVTLPGWVRIRSERNYRSPADILGLLNRLPLLPAPIAPGSPLGGSGVEVLVWKDRAELMEKTARAITRGIGLGFKREMIALITYRGRENSVFTPLERIGQHTLKAFHGEYDLLGNPIYAPGDFLIDSVYRFKGQSAPCVIFTEIDFLVLDARETRKLFVGATRAGLKLILVVSERAAGLLAPSL